MKKKLAIIVSAFIASAIISCLYLWDTSKVIYREKSAKYWRRIIRDQPFSITALPSTPDCFIKNKEIDPDALPLLLVLLNDKDLPVRTVAINCIAKLKNHATDAVFLLTQRLEKTENVYEKRQLILAIEAICVESKNCIALPTLHRIATMDEDMYTRSGAAFAIFFISGSTLVLQDLIHNEKQLGNIRNGSAWLVIRDLGPIVDKSDIMYELLCREIADRQNDVSSRLSAVYALSQACNSRVINDRNAHFSKLIESRKSDLVVMIDLACVLASFPAYDEVCISVFADGLSEPKENLIVSNTIRGIQKMGRRAEKLAPNLIQVSLNESLHNSIRERAASCEKELRFHRLENEP